MLPGPGNVSLLPAGFTPDDHPDDMVVAGPLEKLLEQNG
jgi:hypothetical protein